MTTNSTIGAGSTIRTHRSNRTDRRALRVLVGVAAATATLLLGAPLVAAEGSFNSSMSGVLTGFTSRTWGDRNSDGNATRITLRNCTHNWSPQAPKSSELQLTRETPWWQPDENRGRKTFNCGSSATGDWGRQGNSSYHFTVTKIAGLSSGPSLSVGSLTVSY